MAVWGRLSDIMGSAAKRPDSLLHAVEHVIRSQQRVDAEPRYRLLGADGLEARYGERDATRTTLANRSLRIWAAVKSISRMPVASRTISRTFGVEDKIFKTSRRK
jgi:hypothetical protein